jgi:hypothetical protein
MKSDSESVSSADSSVTVPEPEPDTREDLFDEPDLHWLSDDQVQEMHEKLQEGGVKVPPPLKDWVEIHPREMTYQITFGKVRRVL